jgi:dTDP-4-amino-4,6-dideoxygalactose transaminase
MEQRKIPFSPPDITEAEINEVVDALRSGWITTGPKTKELERQVAQRCGTGKAACLNSNTACAEMTLRILGIGPGDEVIVPAYTYTASASVAAHVGATIVPVDCEKGKFTWDLRKLEAAINERTKVVVPVDLFGIPADVDAVLEILESKKHLFTPSQNRPEGQPLDQTGFGKKLQTLIGRPVIMEDAAHSFGAVFRGRPVGSYADFTNFSFHAVKNLTTAEGGAVTWRDIPGLDDEELYRLYMLYSLHGQNKDALQKTQLGSWEYNIAAPWFKCNMTDVHAAIGLAQMRRYDDILLRRRHMIEKYDEAFSVLPLELQKHYTDEYQSSGHLYPIRLTGKTREEASALITKLAERGVAANVHYKPIPLHTGYQEMGVDPADYPNATEQYSNMVTLPLHTVMTDDDQDYVIESVLASYRELFPEEQ